MRNVRTSLVFAAFAVCLLGAVSCGEGTASTDGVNIAASDNVCVMVGNSGNCTSTTRATGAGGGGSGGTETGGEEGEDDVLTLDDWFEKYPTTEDRLTDEASLDFPREVLPENPPGWVPPEDDDRGWTLDDSIPEGSFFRLTPTEVSYLAPLFADGEGVECE